MASSSGSVSLITSISASETDPIYERQIADYKEELVEIRSLLINLAIVAENDNNVIPSLIDIEFTRLKKRRSSIIHALIDLNAITYPIVTPAADIPSIGNRCPHYSSVLGCFCKEEQDEIKITFINKIKSDGCKCVTGSELCLYCKMDQLSCPGCGAYGDVPCHPSCDESDILCPECGAHPDAPCHPSCRVAGDEEHSHEDDDYDYDDDHRDEYEDLYIDRYGACMGCTPGCNGCQADFNPADPWGDGAPEEHPGHPAYDGY